MFKRLPVTRRAGFIDRFRSLGGLAVELAICFRHSRSLAKISNSAGVRREADENLPMLARRASIDAALFQSRRDGGK